MTKKESKEESRKLKKECMQNQSKKIKQKKTRTVKRGEGITKV